MSPSNRQIWGAWVRALLVVTAAPVAFAVPLLEFRTVEDALPPGTFFVPWLATAGRELVLAPMVASLVAVAFVWLRTWPCLRALSASARFVRLGVLAAVHATVLLAVLWTALGAAIGLRSRPTQSLISPDGQRVAHAVLTPYEFLGDACGLDVVLQEKSRLFMHSVQRIENVSCAVQPRPLLAWRGASIDVRTENLCFARFQASEDPPRLRPPPTPGECP